MNEASDIQVKKSFLKRVWRKWKWLIIGLAAAALIYFVFILPAQNKAPDFVTTAVQRQNLRQIVDAAGTVESTKAINLSFNQGGQVALVKTNVGAKVKAGDLLASLAAQKQEAQVLLAQAGVASAQADLLRVEGGASAQDLTVAAQRVASAQSQLDAAQSSLVTLQDQQQSDISNWSNSLSNSLTTNLFVLSSAMDAATNVLYDSKASVSFNANSADSYSHAKLQDQQLHSSLLQLASQITSVQASSLLLNTAASELSMASNIQSHLDDILNLIQRLYPTSVFSQTEIDALKASIVLQQTNLSATISGIQTAKATLENGLASYNSKLDQAQSTINDAKAALDLAQAQQQQTAAPARTFDVAQAQAKVDQARASLTQALAVLEDYRVRAPIDGVITRVDIHTGDQVQPTVEAISILGDVSLQIKVKVAESDIAKVSAGQTATITLDAFGDQLPFAGQVGEVDLAPTLIDSVVYYYVTVVFVGDVTNVKLGMSADVNILTASRENVLVIPDRAVKLNGNTLYVQIPDSSGVLHQQTVTIGLKGEDGLDEVISGLTEGQNVVTLNKAAP